MRFQIGDTVKVKDNAYQITHSVIGFSDSMRKYCGKTFTVRRITNDNCYKLEEATAESEYMNGDGYWKWVEDWIEEPDEVMLKIENVSEAEIMSLFK